MKTLALVVSAALLAFSTAASAQRISLGLGGGIAGGTDESLSYGKGGPVGMVQVTTGVVPLVGVGVEVDYWRRRVVSATFATAILQLHIPTTGIALTAGAGYGSGNPGALGQTSGVAGQLGASYDFGIPYSPVGVMLFGNAFLEHASQSSMQMVDAGLAISFH